MWNDTLLIPVVVAALSVVVLLLHGTAILLHRAFKQSSTSTSAPPPAPAATATVARFKLFVAQNGGLPIFLWKVTRFFGCFTLCVVSITTTSFSSHSGPEDIPYLKGLADAFEEHGWINFLPSVIYAYASMLAIWALVANIYNFRYIHVHLGTVLFATWATFVYRDIYPLATYDKPPVDIPLDPLFWPKFGLLTLVGVVVPLLIPNPYIPVDPLNPFPEPAPEQTASLMSFMLFSFLDPLVWAGYNTAHLAYDQLPPLADYDTAQHLKDRTFKHMDPFITNKKRNVVFGLLSIFKTEYAVLSACISLRVLFSIFAPVGLNRLLAYIESGGTIAPIRPWVWIVWLLVGPIASSIAMQSYVFVDTRMFVRMESFITELVFEHSLRIRMKEETTSAPTPTTTPTGSEAATVIDSDEEPDSSQTEASTTVIGSENSAAATKSDAKGKKPALPPRSANVAPPATIPPGKKENAPAANLIGKINNLVTSGSSCLMLGRPAD